MGLKNTYYLLGLIIFMGFIGFFTPIISGAPPTQIPSSSVYELYDNATFSLPTTTSITNSTPYTYYDILSQNSTLSESINATPTDESGHYRGTWSFKNGSVYPFIVKSGGSLGTITYESVLGTHNSNVKMYISSAGWLESKSNTSFGVVDYQLDFYIYMGATTGNTNKNHYVGLHTAGGSWVAYVNFARWDSYAIYLFSEKKAEIKNNTYVESTWIRVSFINDVNGFRILINGNTYFNSSQCTSTIGYFIDSINTDAGGTNNNYFDAIGLTTYGYTANENLLLDQVYSFNQSRFYNFTAPLKDIRNFTVQQYSNTNITQQINCTISNYITNRNETYLTVNDSTTPLFFTHTINEYAQNYFNASQIRLTYAGYNATSPFFFNFSVVVYVDYYNGTITQIAPNILILCATFTTVNEMNNISIRVQHSTNPIDWIFFYSNITVNESIGRNEGLYTEYITNSTAQYYSIVVFVNDTRNNWISARVDNLVIKPPLLTLEIELDNTTDFEIFYDIAYIVVCFAVFGYLVVKRQKDEPILIPFIILLSIPMFTNGYWQLGLMFLFFYIYRCIIQIYQKMSGYSVENS